MQINHIKSTKFTVIKLTKFKHHHTDLRDQSVLITMQYGTMVHFNVSDFNIIVKKDESALRTEIKVFNIDISLTNDKHINKHGWGVFATKVR